MNILSLFPLIPLVMMLGLWISKNTRQIHAVMVAGSSALLALAIYLVFHYLGLREAGATDAMLLTDRVVWYQPSAADLEVDRAGTLAALTPTWVTPVMLLLVVTAIVAAFKGNPTEVYVVRGGDAPAAPRFL